MIGDMVPFAIAINSPQLTGRQRRAFCDFLLTAVSAQIWQLA